MAITANAPPASQAASDRLDRLVLREQVAMLYSTIRAATLGDTLLALTFGAAMYWQAPHWLVLVWILLHLYNTSRPHVAEVGLVPGSQHFRNINRHEVQTDPCLLTLRVDESLFFANARFLEDLIQRRVTEGCAIRHVVLMFSAVNSVDYSALESLEAINHRLRDMGVGLHLSEVKGPVMDRLQRAHLLSEMNGRVFLSQYDAWRALACSAP